MTNTSLPPISALRALEPRPGGQWAIYEQEGDTTSLSYVMNNGTEAITYTLHQCKTEEDIRKHCAGFVYEYTDDFDAGNYAQRVGELLPERGNMREVASQMYQTQPSILSEHYPTSQSQQPFQEPFLFNAQTAMISSVETHIQANAQFEQTAVIQQSELNQEEQGYLTSEGQPPSLGGFASGAAKWPLGDDYFPTTAQNNLTSMQNAEIRMSQDMSMLMDSWGHSWANDTQGSDGDWDSLLPHA